MRQSKIGEFFCESKPVGTIQQEAGEARFRKYTLGCLIMITAVIAIVYGAIVSRDVEQALISKYRGMIISDTVDDTSPNVREPASQKRARTTCKSSQPAGPASLCHALLLLCYACARAVPIVW